MIDNVFSVIMLWISKTRKCVDNTLFCLLGVEEDDEREREKLVYLLCVFCASGNYLCLPQKRSLSEGPSSLSSGEDRLI